MTGFETQDDYTIIMNANIMVDSFTVAGVEKDGAESFSDKNISDNKVKVVGGAEITASNGTFNPGINKNKFTTYVYDMNTKFKTYATYFIKGEIKHYLRDKASIIKAHKEGKKLPEAETIFNKIAAGEVIERPASVSGCFKRPSIAERGQVATSAPACKQATIC